MEIKRTNEVAVDAYSRNERCQVVFTLDRQEYASMLLLSQLNTKSNISPDSYVSLWVLGLDENSNQPSRLVSQSEQVLLEVLKKTIQKDPNLTLIVNSRIENLQFTISHPEAIKNNGNLIVISTNKEGLDLYTYIKSWLDKYRTLGSLSITSQSPPAENNRVNILYGPLEPSLPKSNISGLITILIRNNSNTEIAYLLELDEYLHDKFEKEPYLAARAVEAARDFFARKKVVYKDFDQTAHTFLTHAALHSRAEMTAS